MTLITHCMLQPQSFTVKVDASNLTLHGSTEHLAREKGSTQHGMQTKRRVKAQGRARHSTLYRRMHKTVKNEKMRKLSAL